MVKFVNLRPEPAEPRRRPFAPGEYLRTVFEKHLPDGFGALPQRRAEGNDSPGGGPRNEVEAFPDRPSRLLFQSREYRAREQAPESTSAQCKYLKRHDNIRFS